MVLVTAEMRMWGYVGHSWHLRPGLAENRRLRCENSIENRSLFARPKLCSPHRWNGS